MVTLKNFEMAIKEKEKALINRNEILIQKNMMYSSEEDTLVKEASSLTKEEYIRRRGLQNFIKAEIDAELKEVTTGWELLEKEKQLFILKWNKEASNKGK